MLLIPALDLYPELSAVIEKFRTTYRQLPVQRIAHLEKMAKELAGRDQLNLNFICTHNSRRSHLAQIWAATAAAYFGLSGIATFSGGTEATAFNPRAVAALERIGFKVQRPGGENPAYAVQFSDQAAPLICFSKKFDHPVNPVNDSVAIMVCSDAETNCPFIPGALLRLPLTYRDPKEADDTPAEASRYDERTYQIGQELCYLFEALKNQRNA